MIRILLILTLFVSNTFAQSTYRWLDLIEGETYKINTSIELTELKKNMTISKDSSMKLQSIKLLPMINVYMAELKLINCSDSNFASEMILLEITQPSAGPISAGVDIARGCVLEVFIEKKDFNSRSIFY